MKNNDRICGHKNCDRSVALGEGKVRYIDGEAVPFHTGCFYAHPDYDVSKGFGSPFAEIKPVREV